MQLRDAADVLGVHYQTAYAWVRQGVLPALMATACLREDHWLVHHLASDLPVAEVTGLAREAGAGLVVLSSAMTEAASLAAAAAEITRSAAGLAVLTGRSGDSLSQLRQLARDSLAAPVEI